MENISKNVENISEIPATEDQVEVLPDKGEVADQELVKIQNEFEKHTTDLKETDPQ